MTSRTEPVVLAALLASTAVAVAEYIRSGTTDVDAWTALLVALPLLTGAATRPLVMPVKTVQDTIEESPTAQSAVNALAVRVGLRTRRGGSA